MRIEAGGGLSLSVAPAAELVCYAAPMPSEQDSAARGNIAEFSASFSAKRCLDSDSQNVGPGRRGEGQRPQAATAPHREQHC